MADAILSIVLDRLASLIERQIHQEVSLVVGVEREIESLTNTFQIVRAVVADAEKRQVKEELVKVWLERLKDIAYQTEDVLDEWSTSVLKLEIERVESSSTPKNKVSSWIPSPCIYFKKFYRRHDIALKIKDLQQEVDDIANQSNRFDFTSISYDVPQRFITISAVDILEVYGRDEDRDIILRKLLLDRNCEPNLGFYTISVVGMGGVGKTTLAQLVFNHDEVKAHFDERVWVCASDPFVPMRILRAIFEALQGQSTDLHYPESLQQKIQESMEGKKFLLVLDDVWNEDDQLWEQLKNCLKCGGDGSRILVTTRNESVARMMRSTYIHSLASLSLEQSEALFGQIAFFGSSREKIEELQEICIKIADKCKGLPLAIKALGSLMQSKDDKEDWENVLNSEMWELDVFEKKLSAALLLSYYDLPPVLKQCFSYCAVFPKDHTIQVSNLIKLWMAQGYLNSKSGREMEIIGREYFENLAARSLFQDFGKDNQGKIERCKMHDIVHDFAQFLTHNECLIMGYDSETPKMNLSFEKVRHAALTSQEGSRRYSFSIDNVRNLHTLLIQSQDGPSALASFQHLTCLRALDLRHNYSIVAIPRTLGELIHLRYLNLSYCSELETLPETISELLNLQTLNVWYCSKLRKLPQGITRLINLRHLIIGGGRHGLQSLPKGVGRLTCLRTLPFFIVSDKCKIKELGNLKELRGQLEIRGLCGVEDPGEAEIAELMNKKDLHHLTLEFSLRKQVEGEGMRMRMRMKEKDVAEALQPHPNLRSLSIVRYNSTKLPTWITSSCLTGLTYLELIGCRQCQCLPPLGELPLLKSLELSLMDSMTHLGSEFLGSSLTLAFPKLEHLYFATMGGWEKWEVEEERGRIAMPRLLTLALCSCPKLIALPNFLLERTPPLKLTIRDCTLLEQNQPWQIEERDCQTAAVET